MITHIHFAMIVHTVVLWIFNRKRFKDRGMMEKLLGDFNEYINNTSPEQLESDWASIDHDFIRCPSSTGFKIGGAWCCDYHYSLWKIVYKRIKNRLAHDRH